MRLAKRMIAAAIAALPAMSEAEPVALYAAGSLTTALGEDVEGFTQAHGVEVATSFGPSGLMRERIEAGEAAHVFASANMAHPRTLARRGAAGRWRCSRGTVSARWGRRSWR